MGARLKVAIGVTAAILVAELVFGYLANSLALLSDAGHVFADILALVLSWFGVRQAARPATSRMTYGYHRVGILIAVVNAVSLIGIGGGILYEAWHRFLEPSPVQSLLMLPVAVLGLLANIGVALYLREAQRHDLNVRSAFLHVIGDALSSVGVIIAAVAIQLTGQYWPDTAVSAGIAAIIVLGGCRLLREAMHVLLQASPRGLDVDTVAGAIGTVPGVGGVHDLHVWSLTPSHHVLSSHVVVSDASRGDEVIAAVQRLLADRFGIGHSTLQLEVTPCLNGDLFCNLGLPAEAQQEGHRH